MDFPRLTEEYIRELTFGVYQPEQAKSYTNEHLQDGIYEFEFTKFDKNIIKVKLGQTNFTSCISSIFSETISSNFAVSAGGEILQIK